MDDDEDDDEQLTPEAKAWRNKIRAVLVVAELDLLDLTVGQGATVEEQQAQAEQSRRVWELQAMLYRALGRLFDAAKASSAAVDQGKLAVSLSKSKLADRVAHLERVAANAQVRGSRIRTASKAARAK